MSLWNPTCVQFTVLRARNLISKGKGGNNDVYVTIQLGKEKYQTSTIKNALNPEWFEECNLPIQHMGLDIEVFVFHRKALADDFLGYAAIPLRDYKTVESSKSSWLQLHNKPTKTDGEDKYRGELEVKLTFHCQSRPDNMSHGLKKKSTSIRSLTSAFGDKFKLTRSLSFRENRRHSEAAQMDKCQAFGGKDLNISMEEPVETLTRSYSMSTAYIKSMSLDRNKVANFGSSDNSSKINNNCNNSFTDQGVSENNSQALYSLPIRHKSEIVCNKLPPPPYDLKHASKDDSSLTTTRNYPGTSDQHISSTSRQTPPLNPLFFESNRRDMSGIYESIKEKTEPENSVSSSSDPESVPKPKPRTKRFRRAMASRNKNEAYVKENIGLPFTSGKTNSSDQQPFNGRDSGIIDDRSSSLGNSLDGSLATTDGTNNGSKTRNNLGYTDSNMNKPRPEVPFNSASGDRGILYHLDKEMSLKSKKKVLPASLFYSKENKYGELVVRKKSKGKRDRDKSRLLQITQSASGLYDDSDSGPSNSSRTDVPDDLLSVFKNMTRDELLRVVITSKAQMIRKDQYIKDLENYIDDLLVRVMETTPRLLTRQPFHRF